MHVNLSFLLENVPHLPYLCIQKYNFLIVYFSDNKITKPRLEEEGWHISGTFHCKLTRTPGGEGQIQLTLLFRICDLVAPLVWFYAKVWDMKIYKL